MKQYGFIFLYRLLTSWIPGLKNHKIHSFKFCCFENGVSHQRTVTYTTHYFIIKIQHDQTNCEVDSFCYVIMTFLNTAIANQYCQHWSYYNVNSSIKTCCRILYYYYRFTLLVCGRYTCELLRDLFGQELNLKIKTIVQWFVIRWPLGRLWNEYIGKQVETQPDIILLFDTKHCCFIVYNINGLMHESDNVGRKQTRARSLLLKHLNSCQHTLWLLLGFTSRPS